MKNTQHEILHLKDSSFVEWTCCARPADTGKTCFHKNKKKHNPRGLFGHGLFCDKCGRGKGASDARLAKGDIDKNSDSLSFN